MDFLRDISRSISRNCSDLSYHCSDLWIMPSHQSTPEQSSRETSPVMSSPYSRGLELLDQVREEVNNMEPDARKHRITVQRWYALGQKWNSLRMALLATGDAADKAITARKRQRVRHTIWVNMTIRSGNIRARQAKICLRNFRHVTALSQHVRTLRQCHERELLSWRNCQDHYQGALGPHAHIVRPHQTFLDTLGQNIESVRRHQGLEMVYTRWLHLRAAADLKQNAKNFHLTCKRLSVQKRRADRETRRSRHIIQETDQCVEEYEQLETKVLDVQKAIQALQNMPLGSNARETAGSASTSIQIEDSGHVA